MASHNIHHARLFAAAFLTLALSLPASAKQGYSAHTHSTPSGAAPAHVFTDFHPTRSGGVVMATVNGVRRSFTPQRYEQLWIHYNGWLIGR